MSSTSRFPTVRNCATLLLPEDLAEVQLPPPFLVETEHDEALRRGELVGEELQRDAVRERRELLWRAVGDRENVVGRGGRGSVRRADGDRRRAGRARGRELLDRAVV